MTQSHLLLKTTEMYLIVGQLPFIFLSLVPYPSYFLFSVTCSPLAQGHDFQDELQLCC